MRIVLFFSMVLIQASCSQKCPECPEDEISASNEKLTVDVPKEMIKRTKPANALSIQVTEDNRYIIDYKEVAFDSIEGYVGDLRINDPNFDDVIRIEGHKDARFEAVFKLMALAEKLSLRPALAYKSSTN